jgi:hypothetical protein
LYIQSGKKSFEIRVSRISEGKQYVSWLETCNKKERSVSMTPKTTEPKTLWGRFWAHLWAECDPVALWINGRLKTKITGKRVFFIAAVLVVLGAMALVIVKHKVVLL